MSLPEFCPGPPDWVVPWDDLNRAYDWVRALADCPQDPVHHAEGDVGIHTRMVCEELARLPAWRALPDDDRDVVFAAAVLHDVAKPECTRRSTDPADGGRLTARGHSRRGAIRARGILWRQGVPFAARERVCALIRYHQVPYFAIDRPDTDRLCLEISHVGRCDHLALLAEADVRGRICADQQRLLDNVGLFAEHSRELGCLSAPYPFASDHARLLYFRDPSRHPDAPAHEAFRADVVLLSGLPGSGKDHYLRHHLGDRLAISLDDLRAELDVNPADDQAAVVVAARERAREALRAGTSFVWNATNLSRQLRGQPLSLFASYGARVSIVYLEVSPAVLFAQNRHRARVVPASVIERLIDRWEVPDVTEAHAVTWVT